MKYAALIIFWVIWCSIHSGMISISINGYLKDRFGRYFKFYRLFYNFFSGITILPLILYTTSLKGYVLFRWEGYLIYVQFILIAISLTLLIAGMLKYDMFQFVGIRQIISSKYYSALSENGELITSGILSVTRHPWYLASIIFVWVYYRNMYLSTLIVNILLTCYLVIGTILEERKLIKEFGDSYRGYMQRVSMLFPSKWILSNHSKD